MKIAYDGSGLTPPLTGVGNYVRHLLESLLAIDHENEYWLMSHRRPQLGHAISLLRGWSGNGNAALFPVRFPNRTLWMQGLLPLALRTLHPDVAHFTNFLAPLASDGNMVVTVHDVSLVRFPRLYSPRQRVLMRPLVGPAARRARAIIAVSEHSKREIVRTLGVSPQVVHVIYEAAAPDFHEEPVEEPRARLMRYGWDHTAHNLLYVGTVEPRKNVERLVRALDLLHKSGRGAHLWIVGQSGWRSDLTLRPVRALGLERFVHVTGYVPVADLRAFYRACDLFVFPSLYEGFGLPAVEAITCGAPVALSDIPSLREIGDDAALYFDPTDVESIAGSLSRLLGDEALREDLRARALTRAAQFSWERAARQTLEVYREVAANDTFRSPRGGL